MAPNAQRHGRARCCKDIGKNATPRQEKSITQQSVRIHGNSDESRRSAASAGGLVESPCGEKVTRLSDGPAMPANSEKPIPNVLTIAGSDSGGCAGIQADLRAFSAQGLHGLSVITAVTAQNTTQVASIHRVPAREVARQLEALFADFRIGAIKIGMLGSATTMRVVTDFLRARAIRNIVIDPL